MALVPHGAWTAGVVIYALCEWDCLLSMFLHLPGICAPLAAWRGAVKKKEMRNDSREIHKKDKMYSYRLLYILSDLPTADDVSVFSTRSLTLHKRM
jgi:hypothetical protein